MNNLVAAIEYDGTKFQGSQKQPNVRTVQGAFDKSLTLIHKKNVISEFVLTQYELTTSLEFGGVEPASTAIITR